MSSRQEIELCSEEEATKNYIVSEVHLFGDRLVCLMQKDHEAYDYFTIRHILLTGSNHELLDIKITH